MSESVSESGESSGYVPYERRAGVTGISSRPAISMVSTLDSVSSSWCEWRSASKRSSCRESMSCEQRQGLPATKKQKR